MHAPNHTQRNTALQQWLHTQLPNHTFHMTPLAGDASFRRYFRLHHGDTTLIAVDAPPEHENSVAFIGVASTFARLGLHVPQIIAADIDSGFLLLSDLGDGVYFNVLNTNNATRLYESALNALCLIQSCPQQNDWHFPPFDQRLLLHELHNFRDWYLLRHKQLSLTQQEENLLTRTFTQLIESALAQPQVCVHRDYHSRNLLELPDGQIGILDFQDAVWGPITYDLVSLLRDCYIAWPQQQVLNLVRNYYDQIRQNKALPVMSFEQFMTWFDWMGIQRHLKASYIFARKWHRDHNANYLSDIPRTLRYVVDVTQNYPELAEFRAFLLERAL